jgi:hypothetical protein
MEGFWRWLFELSKRKLKRAYLDNHGHDRECPHCSTWISEVNGCVSYKIEEYKPLGHMVCKKCKKVSVWFDDGFCAKPISWQESLNF